MTDEKLLRDSFDFSKLAENYSQNNLFFQQITLFLDTYMDVPCKVNLMKYSEFLVMFFSHNFGWAGPKPMRLR